MAGKPDIVLRELREEMLAAGHAVSTAQLCASAEGTWAAAEKKSLHAIERDTEANQGRRWEFLQAIRGIAPEDLIYLDESGVSTQT